jgi:Toprim domain
MTAIVGTDLSALARALDGDVIGRDAVAAPGPGHSRRDRSLIIKIDPAAPDGFIAHSHAGDPWNLCKDFVRERLGWRHWEPGDGQNRSVDPSRIREFDRSVVKIEAECRERTKDDFPRMHRAQEIWDQGVDPRRTLAEKYLSSRALILSDDVANTVLRFLLRCPWHNEDTGRTDRVPALLAAFRSLDGDEITAIHRIRVDQPDRWPKADRRMLGVVHRAAIKLDPIGSTVAIGEGVETCLAARQMGHRPAWALGSVGMIAKFPVIEDVQMLRILGETGEASAKAVRLCGNRWAATGRRVQIVMPTTGSDLNDEWRRWRPENEGHRFHPGRGMRRASAQVHRRRAARHSIQRQR